ncbi:MAG: formylglycine-generating enzyme family protein, partial [Trichodesmium sp. MAG_R01]|nr:formylglycine-generating enzyme family protein [Trichodesmium sp. MAG_R01]
MFEKFIAFIKTKEWQLDSMQIAEVLWFVHQVSEQKQEENNSQNLVSSNTEEPAENFDQSYDFQPSKTASIQQQTTTKKTPTRSSSPPYPLTTSSSNKSQNTEIQPTSLTTEKLPIKLPDIAILRNTLELSRLIKPFKQKVNSRVAQELDINETAKISAELSTLNFPSYFPVLTPKQERWLDVVLLIEDSNSMILWQSLLTEVRDFLEHLGAFRDIKLYRIKWDNNSENLQIYPFHSPSLTLSPQELNSSDHRRLILMLSDCISLAWINQKFINTLQKWATKEKLTLLNPFPERMWENTNLCYAIRLRLGNDKKQNSTQKWEAIPVEYWQGKYLNQQTVKLPILNLEPKSMAAWVNVMVGKGISWCAGAGLGLELMGPEPEEEEEPLTPREQINNFYATFSKEAWQLIQWLSAIPINLSTIRLIQRALLPKSTQINVAEVLMGGLLSPVKPFNSYRFPHQIEFEFQPGIREIFLDRLGGEEFCIGVIGRLTEKIASHFGYETIREFEAILLNEPWNFRDDQDIRLIQTFATISVSTLRQYGDKYIDYIPKLDRSRAQLYLMSEVPGESLNWIDFLEKVAQKYRLSSSQKEILINLFPSSQEFLSISELAQKLLSSASVIKGRLNHIFPKFESKNPDLFASQKYSQLEALHLFLSSEYKNSYIPQILENDQIEENLQDLNSEVPGESVKWRDFLENVAQEYDLTSIQTETLINLFSSSQEALYISQAAQKLYLSASAIRGRLTNIFRKFENKNPGLFESRKGSKLEALQSFLFSQYVNLDIPQTIKNNQFQIGEKLQHWSFETPTVNRRGKIINTRTYTASYFIEILGPDINLEMVAIPGGTFTMGSPETEEDSRDNERPQHQVTVPSFFMGKYPVTQGQWKAIATRTDIKVERD